jgi:sugar phosphate isomerase/epimerase
MHSSACQGFTHDKVMAKVRRSDMNFAQAIAANAFTIIGLGSVDFPAFFRVLEKNNYSEWMVVEQDVTFGATVVPPVESVAASLKYLLQASAGWTCYSEKFRA